MGVGFLSSRLLPLLFLALSAGCVPELLGRWRVAAPAGEAARVRGVEGLWYRSAGAGEPACGLTRLRLEVGPNADGQVRVAAVEEYAGAVGPQLRASLWLAVHLAARHVGADPTQHRFLATVSGTLDGPSASGLLAAGFMAALAGAPVRAEATATGALMADGSIAPVGGLYEKLACAARGGKTLLGVRAGQTTVVHGGAVHNLVALGRARGVRVVELHDLHDVYELMTGRPLPQPAPVPPEAMRLGEAETARLRGRVVALLAGAERGLGALTAAGGGWTEQEAERGRRARAEAQRRLAQGDVAAAYLNAAQAAATASAGETLQRMAGQPSGRTELEPLLRRVEQDLAALEGELATVAAAPRGRAMQLVAAYSAAGRARGLYETASILAGVVDDPQLVFPFGSRHALAGDHKRFVPAYYLAQAEQAVLLARDELAAQGPAPERSLDFVAEAAHRAASGLAAAASGSVEYIHALLVRTEAEQRELPLTRITGELGLRRHTYLVAAKLASLAVARKELREGRLSDAEALLRLAEAANAHIEAALVLVEEYLLEHAVPDGSGDVGLRRKQLLGTLGRRAEEASRVAAARARVRLGDIPPKARLFHGAGRELLGGDVDELLRALRYFWRATMASELSLAVLRPATSPPASQVPGQRP